MLPALANRLKEAEQLVARAAQIMRAGYDSDDGKARSLTHDLEYLHARYLDRIRIEDARK